ncbi:TFIIB-type zinc ribbon-containing protein [Metasolibacillus meyeri]|uniref:TFIIB-type zinc ribbon-containing protein n=1 Tax=Metasolibacillus meyeri TaxID=1071052 RepID=UPI000D301A58|nr:TFIIB-type zinc ribbon-containing protein [Metasolibacillus meyeri]
MNTKEQVIEEVTEFDAKCPSCSASIQFNPANGMLTCAYCGYTEEIPLPEEDVQKVAQELNFQEAMQRNSFQWGQEKKTVICDACAAESIYDALEVANVCPYCGSNHVMESVTDTSLAPNGVAPFAITRQQADERFNKWMKGKWFAPNEAKRSAKADAFQGIYLPYWTFDTKTASQYTASYGKHRKVKDKDGNERTETDWFKTKGFYQKFIDDHLIRATTRYDAGILRSVEPFQTGQLQSFNQDYLTGYVAERYSIGIEDGWKIAENEIRQKLHDGIVAQIKKQHRADVVKNVHFSTAHSDTTYKYVMLPLWLSSFRYQNKTYQFMVNGQTGKVGGSSPVSAVKVISAIITVLAFIAIFYFLTQ